MEEAISERYNQMQQNRFENTSTLGRSFLSSAVAAPLIDSYSLNAYSKGTWSKFNFALKNGIYENYTMMGSSVFGGAYEKMLKLKPGAKPIFGGNFSSNFIKKDYSGTGISSKIGEDMIEKGFGFSRNHAPFFKRLNDAGFGNFNYNVLNDSDKTQIARDIIAAKKQGAKNMKMFGSPYLVDGVNLKNIDKNIPMFQLKNLLDGGETVPLDFFKKNASLKDIQTFISGGDLNLSIVNPKYGLSQINAIVQTIQNGAIDIKYLKNMPLNEINELANGISSGVKSIPRTLDLDYASTGKAKEVIEKAQKGGYGKNFSINNIDDFTKNVSADDAKSVFQNFFKGVSADDIISFQQDGMKAGMKFENLLLKNATPEAVELARNELSEVVYKQYFTKTTAQKIMGNPLVMAMTGAGNIGGKLGTAINIAGAVTGVVSNIHQETMIQNTMNMDNFNLIRGENLMNDRTEGATYSNQRASMSNEQDLNYVLSNRNIAEQYSRRQMEPEIDRTKSKKENFTIY